MCTLWLEIDYGITGIFVNLAANFFLVIINLNLISILFYLIYRNLYNVYQKSLMLFAIKENNKKTSWFKMKVNANVKRSLTSLSSSLTNVRSRKSWLFLAFTACVILYLASSYLLPAHKHFHQSQLKVHLMFNYKLNKNINNKIYLWKVYVCTYKWSITKWGSWKGNTL